MVGSVTERLKELARGTSASHKVMSQLDVPSPTPSQDKQTGRRGPKSSVAYEVRSSTHWWLLLELPPTLDDPDFLDEAPSNTEDLVVHEHGCVRVTDDPL